VQKASMTNAVKLYVYDLSNGLARQLSRQFIGKQIDGIWFVPLLPPLQLVMLILSGIHLWSCSGKRYFMDGEFTPLSLAGLMYVYPLTECNCSLALGLARNASRND
jgi:hypothetical protein